MPDGEYADVSLVGECNGKEITMSKTITVVGLGGSLSPNSSSLTALRIALEGAEKAGAKTEIFDIRELNLPMYDPGLSEIPEAVKKLAEATRNADGLIWSSPLYHGTISGSFKNALDWLQVLQGSKPSYLTDKVVGLIGAAGGVQGLQAINTMEFVVRALRGWAVPLVAPIARSWDAFDKDGQAKDPKVGEQLRALGEEVYRASRQFAGQGVTTPEAQLVEAQVEPLDDDEVEALAAG